MGPSNAGPDHPGGRLPGAAPAQAPFAAGSAMPMGFMALQSPRVKSGKATGMLPVATERLESSMTQLHAAAS